MNTRIWFANWTSSVLQRRGSIRKRRGRMSPQSAVAEVLEQKTLLTGLNCFGQIEGVVFHDVNDDMMPRLTSDEPRIGNANVNLYRDVNSDGLLDAGDLLLTFATSDATTGEYKFSGLAADDYIVEQNPGPAGFLQRSGTTVEAVTIDATAAAGRQGLLIDDFTAPAVPGQTLTVTTTTDDSFEAAPGAIGDERDISVEATAGTVTFAANGIAFPNHLNYNANLGATGRAAVVWDGQDMNSGMLTPTGLAPRIDMTVADASGLVMNISSSDAASVRFIVHTDGANSSDVTVPVPASGFADILVPFSSFATLSGTGANFASVGAVELLIEAPIANTNLAISLLKTQAPTIQTVNFANLSPMTVGGTVFRDLDNSGVLASGEPGIQSVDVSLFEDTDGSGDLTVGDMQVGATTQTDMSGNYSFANLFPGEYIVRIDAGNFAATATLENLMSSTGNGIAPDPDNDVNDDDNGDHVGGVTTAIVSKAITLTNRGEPTDDGDADNNTNFSLDFGVSPQIDLVVSKTESATSVVAGQDRLTYVVTVRNDGPSDATGVTVNENLTLPAGVTISTATPIAVSTGTYNTTSNVWTLGNLANGASETLTVVLDVAASTVPGAGVISDTATATANEPESNTTNNSATEATDVTRLVDLVVSKTESATSVVAGQDRLTYVVTVRNDGPSDATGVTVNENLTLPAGVTISTATPIAVSTGTYNTTSNVWTLGNLANGASETLTVVLDVAASTVPGTGVISDTATATANEPESNTTNNSATEATDVTRLVDLVVSKTESATSVVAGQDRLTYVVTVRNDGPSDATGVTVNENLTLPAGVTISTATPIAVSTGTYNTTSNVWTLGNLANGASETLTVVLDVAASTVPGTGVISDTATATANEPESNTTNNSATEATDVTRLVDLVVSKTESATSVVAGQDRLTYVVTVRNDGPSDATGVTVNENLTLPAGVTISTATPIAVSTGTYNTTSNVWTLGNLANGASETLTVVLDVAASTVPGTGVISDTATATANEPESSTTNNSATEATDVTRLVDLVVSKTESATSVVAGQDRLTYVVTVRNDGPSDATGVTVNENLTLPAGVTISTATPITVSTGTYNTTSNVWTLGNLANGASETLTVVLDVAASTVPGTGVISDTATATANEPESSTTNNSATEATDVTRLVDLVVSKTESATSVVAGQDRLTYVVTVRNDGPSDATGVTVNENLTLPAGVTISTATPIAVSTGTYNTTSNVWTLGNLANGASETLTVVLDVAASTVPGTGVISDTATATANEPESNTTNNSATEATDVTRLVDLVVSKTESATSVVAGQDRLTYVVTVRNDGPSDATGVTVNENLTLPAGVTISTATPIAVSTGTYNTTSNVWTLGNLANGASETLTVVLDVAASTVPGTGVISDTATATANEPESNTTNNSATEATDVTRLVDLVVSKTESATSVVAGQDRLTYVVTVRNDGPSDATGVTVNENLTLPAGVTISTATPIAVSTGTYNTTSNVWTLGNLANGASETLTVVLDVAASTVPGTGVISDTATATANEPESNTTNNSATEATDVTRLVDLVVSKTESATSVVAGQDRLTYVVTVRNDGPSDATGVTVNENLTLPAGVTISTATPIAVSTGTYNTTSNVWTLGNLANGASETLTVVLDVAASTVPGTGVISDTATATANEPETSTTNNSATEATDVTRLVDIAITKRDNIDPVVVGSGASNLTYTIMATNIGPSDATGLVVTDAMIASLPAGMVFVAASGTGGSTFDSKTGVWTIGTLSSGSSRTLDVTLTVGVLTQTGIITNTATVTGLNETDSDPSNNSFDEPTRITHEVDISVTKDDTRDPIIAGSGPGNLVYTLVAANIGPSDATGVEVTDALLANLPAGISFVSVSGTGGSTFNSSSGVWSIGDLAKSASRQLTVTLTVGADALTGTITNVATVSNVNETDRNPTNDSDTEITTVNREIDLSVTKTDQVDPVMSPGIISYTITVRNHGPSTASNVVLTDNLSSQVTFDSVTTSQGTAVENGGVLTAMLGTLTPGSAATINLIVNVDQPDGATITNIATVTATEMESDLQNNTDDETTVVLPVPASISGSVYEDLNNNGLKDAGEVAISGARVGLFGIDVNGNSVIRITHTDVDGTYRFSNLTSGDYNLFEIQPPARVDGKDVAGTGTAGTIVTSNDAFSGIKLPGGSNGVEFNFGEGPIVESKRDFLASNQQLNLELSRQQTITGTASLSGRVIFDINANGTVDAGDFGLGGVTVVLVGTDTSSNPVVIYRTTAGDGSYTFNNLAAGTYSIIESQPPGFTDGAEIAGTLMSGTVLDDVFGTIALPDGAGGTGFDFLELPLGSATAGAKGNKATVFAAQPVESGARSVISWDPVAGAAHYDVWLSQLTGNKGLVYRNQNVSGTSLELPDGLNLATHRFWVRGIDAQGRAYVWSEPITFDLSPRVDIVSPAAKSVDATPLFDWTDIANAESYDFRLQDLAGNELLSLHGLTESEYTAVSELPAGNYRYWVRGRSGEFVGEWTDAHEFSVSGVPTTLAPVTASILAAPLLEWTDSGAEYYEVWVNDVTSGSSFVCLEEVYGTSMLMDHGLSSGGRYRYWVRGMDQAGNASKWSSARTFTLAERTEVTSPKGNAASGDVTVTWNPVPGATHYYVWISNETEAFIREPKVAGASYTPATTLPDGDYRVWVQAFGVHSSNSWSAVSKFSVGGLATPEMIGPSATTANRMPTFTWEAISGADRYELWVNHVGVTNRIIHDTSITSTSFTAAANLAPGSYRIWIRAMNAGGQKSAWSAAYNVSIN